MRITVELEPAQRERLVREARERGAKYERDVLAYIAHQLLEQSAGEHSPWMDDDVLLIEFKEAPDLHQIKSRDDVMGGDACIRDTRISVWTLVDYKRQGLSDSQILGAFPSLNASDLAAAWDYYAVHAAKIDAQRRRHEDAA